MPGLQPKIRIKFDAIFVITGILCTTVEDIFQRISAEAKTSKNLYFFIVVVFSILCVVVLTMQTTLVSVSMKRQPNDISSIYICAVAQSKANLLLLLSHYLKVCKYLKSIASDT